MFLAGLQFEASTPPAAGADLAAQHAREEQMRAYEREKAEKAAKSAPLRTETPETLQRRLATAAAAREYEHEQQEERRREQEERDRLREEKERDALREVEAAAELVLTSQKERGGAMRSTSTDDVIEGERVHELPVPEELPAEFMDEGYAAPEEKHSESQQPQQHGEEATEGAVAGNEEHEGEGEAGKGKKSKGRKARKQKAIAAAEAQEEY